MKLTHSFYLLFGLLTLVSCIKSENSELKFSVTGNKKLAEVPAKKSDREPAAVSFSKGKTLWENNCAICHTNAITQLPEKIYSTIEDIERGLLRNDMNPKQISPKVGRKFDFLTKEDKQEVFNYLNHEIIEFLQARKSDTLVKSKPILGTQRFMISKLSQIYLKEVKNNNIQKAINYIESFGGIFGGTCASNYEECKGEILQNQTAKMNGEANIMRTGVLIKVCREIHEENEAILNALTYAELREDSPINQENIKKMMDALIPGEQDPEIIKLLEKKFGSSSDKIAGWKMISYVLCSTPLFERL